MRSSLSLAKAQFHPWLHSALWQKVEDLLRASRFRRHYFALLTFLRSVDSMRDPSQELAAKRLLVINCSRHSTLTARPHIIAANHCLGASLPRCLKFIRLTAHKKLQHRGSSVALTAEPELSGQFVATIIHFVMLSCMY